MKKIFIAGNWKSNKTTKDAGAWIDALSLPQGTYTAVLFAPYTLLPFLRQEIVARKIPLQLGAQDVSPFSHGAYTGEVTAEQIGEFAEWAMIGHSERRKYFGETDEMLFRKVEQAKAAGLSVLYCVPDEHALIPSGVSVVAYEPVWAIGSGTVESPQAANAVISTLKEKIPSATFLYGGSVTGDSVRSLVSMSAIDGVLPGGASLDPHSFSEIIAHAI